MTLLLIILSLFFGILLSGIWFGSVILIDSLGRTYKLPIICFFKTVIAAVIPTLLIVIFIRPYSFDFTKGWNIFNVFIACITVVLTSFIISFTSGRKLKTGKALFQSGIDGMLMEVPQRLMMQTFLWGMLQIFHIKDAGRYAILCNAIVWCISILIQYIISKERLEKNAILEILASFVFSIGVGYIFYQNCFIILPMAAHFCERMLSNLLIQKKSSRLS